MKNEYPKSLLEASRYFANPDVKVGTIFEDSPVPLDKWLVAVWLVVNCKNGISSYEIARDLKVTQKSAWFMLHRIRAALQDGTFEMMPVGLAIMLRTYF
jgi:hypothetical protein